jgi:hypothetical protein
MTERRSLHEREVRDFFMAPAQEVATAIGLSLQLGGLVVALVARQPELEAHIDQVNKALGTFDRGELRLPRRAWVQKPYTLVLSRSGNGWPPAGRP